MRAQSRRDKATARSHAGAILLTAALLAPAACRQGAGTGGGAAPQAPPPPAPAATPTPAEGGRAVRAKEAVGALRTRLLEALQAGLAQGPEQAIAACREQAPLIAADVSAAGVRVGRTSHRLRNPANAPAEWLAPVLERYASGAESAPSLTVDLPDGSLGYVEPIKTGAPCLTCHGAQVAEPLQARLRELYPEDRATGFAEGDLRGLFWAIVPPG